MTDPASDRPQRRPRYRGKNPRHFREKYKELDPERYADDVAKVLSRGMTPAGTHRPVMVREILHVLAPQPGEIAVDCTLGYGGHARELLAAVQPGGRLLAMDVDPIELPKAEARLRTLGFPRESLVVRRINYAGAAKFLAAEAPDGADVLLADLGLSSMQIDDPDRGFTYKADAPLDMRMNPHRGQTATALLSKLSEGALAKLLAENGDEPFAAELSAAILHAHRLAPISTTRTLAEVVSAASGEFPYQSGNIANNAIRRTFQALRIAVNDEFGALDALLRNLPLCLKPGGRVAILTFHSGEDRRVKLAFKHGLQIGTYQSIATDVVRVGAEERRDNPRSAAGKLRFAVRGPCS